MLLAACPGDPDPLDPEEENGSTVCIFDHADNAEEAGAIGDGEAVTGYLCPEGDEDWFGFQVAQDRPLVSLSLAMQAPLSPVLPTYLVRLDEGGVPGAVVATPPPLRASGVHDDVHCLDEGDYFLLVRDGSGDGEDRRHPYDLSIVTEPHPDSAPRTFGPDDARPLADGQIGEGFVACSGEANWWSIQVPARRIARVQLSREPAEWAPALRVHDPEGAILLSASDPSGPIAATLIERLIVLPEAGTYYLEVAADDGVSADPSVSYQLQVELIEDLDQNEPNDSAASATALASRSCGGSWSSAATASGTFGVPGDQDWFRLPLDGCDRGVLEARLTLDTSSLSHEEAWLLQESLQSSIVLVRPHPASPCENGSECALLQQACNSEWDCAGYGHLCTGGRCSGAMVCLAEDVCGAAMVQRSYQRAVVPAEISGPPPSNEAVISVPLFGDPHVYLNVGDWQSDGAAPELTYTLTVRVRADPDTNEPSNLYVPDRERADSIRRQLDAARNQGLIPVRDCTAGDCCGAGTWIEGAISYELDEDYYAYPHPCLGEDCMVRVHYELDPGPVDFLFSIYAGNNLWFDGFTGTEQLAMQPARSGTFGGLTAQDQCFYAFQSHSGYALSIRDLADERDWDPGQRYRFCIEKIANQCVEPPCYIREGGCDTRPGS